MSAIAVVDEISNELVGNLSASDLRGLTNETFKIVRTPVLSFLKKQVGKRGSCFYSIGLNCYCCLHKQRGEEAVVNKCTGEDSLESVINTIVSHRHHRVWVVDSKNRPIGVISLTDICKIAL